MSSDVSPQPRPWSVLKDLFKVLGLDDEVLGLVIKALGWPCQFVLELVHPADSHVTVLCQCLFGNVCMSLLIMF